MIGQTAAGRKHGLLIAGLLGISALGLYFVIRSGTGGERRRGGALRGSRRDDEAAEADRRYFLRNWDERLERATRFLSRSNKYELSTAGMHVYDDTKILKITQIRDLAKHYGAKKIPTDRLKASRALAVAYMKSTG